jgi:hypothetical protein
MSNKEHHFVALMTFAMKALKQKMTALALRESPRYEIDVGTQWGVRLFRQNPSPSEN